LSNNGLTNNSTVSNGVNTIEFNTINNNGNYSGEQITVTDNSGNTDTLIIPDFVVHVGTYPKYLSAYSSYGSGRLYNFQDAVNAMEQTSDAGGITYNISGNYYTIRLGTILYNSPNQEISWLKRELMSFSNPPPTGDVSLGYIYNHTPNNASYGTGTQTFRAFLRDDFKIGWINMTNTTSGITPYKWNITPTSTPNVYTVTNIDLNSNTNTYTFKIIYQLTDNNNNYYLVVNNANNQIIRPNFSISNNYIVWGFKGDMLTGNPTFESSLNTYYNASNNYSKNDCWLIDSFTNFTNYIPSTYPTRINIGDQFIYPNFLMSPNSEYIVYIQRDGNLFFSRTHRSPAPSNRHRYYIASTGTHYNGYSASIRYGRFDISRRSNPSVTRWMSSGSNINYMEVKDDGTFKGYNSSNYAVYTFAEDTSSYNNTVASGYGYGNRTS
jgi:hypothetical protein